MPLITDFQQRATARDGLQPTEVVAGYKIFERDGKAIFQIDTGGSATRQNPGKQSQTFQLSEASARQLWKLLGQTYRFK